MIWGPPTQLLTIMHASWKTVASKKTLSSVEFIIRISSFCAKALKMSRLSFQLESTLAAPSAISAPPLASTLERIYKKKKME